MGIKNRLKSQYWLWGILFAIGLAGIIALFFYPSDLKSKFYYIYLHAYFTYFVIFCGVLPELIKKLLRWFTGSLPNTWSRIIALICLILTCISSLIVGFYLVLLLYAASLPS